MARRSVPQRLDNSQYLSKAQELAGLRVRLLHQVAELEQRIQGLLHRPALEQAMREGRLAAPDVHDLLMAAGWSRESARDAAKGMHKSWRPQGEPCPPLEFDGEFLPPPGPRGRRPVKYQRGGPALRGHPLD